MREQATWEMAKELHGAGYYIGPRDPSRNRAFKGAYMVCLDVNEGPSDDASNSEFCIVGDDLGELVTDAHVNHFG